MSSVEAVTGPSARPTIDTAPAAPSALRCGISIFVVKASLKILGFARTIGWIGRRVGAVPRDTAANADTVKATEHAVAMGAAFYPGRALCLEQSLALYYLLRRVGVAVKYCQGVQPHPFEGHVWIEYHGEVVNDVAEHVKHFVRLPDLLP